MKIMISKGKMALTVLSAFVLLSVFALQPSLAGKPGSRSLRTNGRGTVRQFTIAHIGTPRVVF